MTRYRYLTPEAREVARRLLSLGLAIADAADRHDWATVTTLREQADAVRRELVEWVAAAVSLAAAWTDNP